MNGARISDDVIMEACTLPNQVKLIIWDLDDTFWEGTLTEGGTRTIDSNIALVKTLCARGIISSICSKNNLDEVRKLLEQMEIWDFFVFPHVAFEAKGLAVAAIIDQASLRPDNVLFIDDNPLNLAEARHFAPNLMTALPHEILPHLLDLPQTSGKDDKNLSRLQQYKNLEKKAVDQASAATTNEEFLRSCNIRLSVDYDIEKAIDRVVELINRSNQLNFTKVRIETQEQLDAFKKSLDEFGTSAALVRVSDRYGDYGVVGFYLVSNRDGSNSLLHFVFSCRTMNMGVEQFIYELLGRPAIDIVEPVANRLDVFSRVDWITQENASLSAIATASTEKLTLIGGCDLLQMASYCSANRAEYVNQIYDGVIRHYDDVGFILSDRDVATNSRVLGQIPCWTADDAVRFDRDLSDSGVIIVSLWNVLFGQYLMTEDGVLVRCSVGKNTLSNYVRDNLHAPFVVRSEFLELSLKQKAELIRRSFTRIALLSHPGAMRVIIGQNVRTSAHGVDLRHYYNNICRKYCEESGLFKFFDVDKLIEASDVIDGTHLKRIGYFKLAEKIGELIRQPGIIGVRDATDRQAAGFSDVIKRVWLRRRGAPLSSVFSRLIRLPTKLTNGAIAL